MHPNLLSNLLTMSIPDVGYYVPDVGYYGSVLWTLYQILCSSVFVAGKLMNELL